MAGSEKHSHSAVEKLRFLNSPLRHDQAGEVERSAVATTVSVLETGSQPQEEFRLIQENDTTNSEIFYDLFLACLNLFGQNQRLDTLAGLSAYIGFFVLIWTTWFLTTMYDVRFLRDSIFERCTRGVHLGVLIGFVTVSPNFDPNDQDPLVFKTFTIILMASRLCLALEYSTILFHLWRYKSTRLPLIALVVQNFLCAMIYLGVAFRFRKGANSHVFVLWYITAIVEIAVVIFLSHRFRFLSFHGTYIMKRIGLLTCIFFGEGVASACAGITKVVKVEEHAAVWTNATIGTVTACVAIIYVVFMVYSDWVHKLQLPSWRQITWTVLHFPLHLVMSLFMEGCTQFIVFWKLAEKSLEIIGEFNYLFEHSSAETLVDDLGRLLLKIVERFPPTYTMTFTAMDNALMNISTIDLGEMFTRVNGSEAECNRDSDCILYLNSMNTIYFSLDNSLYNIYGIDYTSDLSEDATANATSSDGIFDIQQNLSTRSYGRSRVVFQYTFVCAGFFLAVANLISVVSRTKKWTRSAIIYYAVIFLVALGMGLVSVVSQNFESLMNYQITPWILPTLLLSYFLILVMNHVSGWLAARRDKRATGSVGGIPQGHLGNPIQFGPGGQQYTAVAIGDAMPQPTAAGFYEAPQAPVPYYGMGHAPPPAGCHLVTDTHGGWRSY